MCVHHTDITRPSCKTPCGHNPGRRQQHYRGRWVLQHDARRGRGRFGGKDTPRQRTQGRPPRANAGARPVAARGRREAYHDRIAPQGGQSDHGSAEQEKFIDMHLLEMQRPAAATAEASQVENNATSAAPVRSSPKTNDAPPMPRGASATLPATSAPHAGPDAQRCPPGPSGRRRTDAPMRRRPLGTRLFERRPPLDRNAPPAPVPPPGSHPAPLPPPEPPPVQHPAPLPPPQPPPELGAGESNDESWAPYHLPPSPRPHLAPGANARPASLPRSPPHANAVPAKRPKGNPETPPPDSTASLSQPNLHRWFPEA